MPGNGERWLSPAAFLSITYRKAALLVRRCRRRSDAVPGRRPKAPGNRQRGSLWKAAYRPKPALVRAIPSLVIWGHKTTKVHINHAAPKTRMARIAMP